jgi:hypothetical protein
LPINIGIFKKLISPIPYEDGELEAGEKTYKNFFQEVVDKRKRR